MRNRGLRHAKKTHDLPPLLGTFKLPDGGRNPGVTGLLPHRGPVEGTAKAVGVVVPPPTPGVTGLLPHKGPVEGTANGVGVVVPPAAPCPPNNDDGDPTVTAEGVGKTLLPHPDFVISIGVLTESLLSGGKGEVNPSTMIGVTTPYFFSSLRRSSCSCPLYFSSSFGISSSLEGLC